MSFITNKKEAILIVKLLKIALEKDELDLEELIVAHELLCDIKHYAEDKKLVLISLKTITAF